MALSITARTSRRKPLKGARVDAGTFDIGAFILHLEVIERYKGGFITELCRLIEITNEIW